eukprot:gene2373-biopygen6795
MTTNAVCRFPYTNADGHHVFSEVTPATAPKDAWQCVVELDGVACGEVLPHDKMNVDSMREHIGPHILRGDIPDTSCGCCGGQGCAPSIKQNQAVIICKAKYFKMYSQKANLDDKAACTNTLGVCPHCPATIWKYGMESHHKGNHSELKEAMASEHSAELSAAMATELPALRDIRPGVTEGGIKNLYKTTDLGKPSVFVVYEITRDAAKGTLYICQSRFIKELLKKANMEAEPGRMEHPIPLDPQTPLPNPEPGDTSTGLPLAHIIGYLNYLAVNTRPDNAQAVNRLARHSANPMHDHMEAATGILKYLAGTPDHGITCTFFD